MNFHILHRAQFCHRTGAYLSLSLLSLSLPPPPHTSLSFAAIKRQATLQTYKNTWLDYKQPLMQSVGNKYLYIPPTRDWSKAVSGITYQIVCKPKSVSKQGVLKDRLKQGYLQPRIQCQIITTGEVIIWHYYHLVNWFDIENNTYQSLFEQQICFDFD